jgi:hypothetical protein
MSVLVAGLFDTGANATEAMDRLLRMNIEDLDTHVIEPGSQDTATGPSVVVPVVPNTGGSGSALGGTAGPLMGAAAGAGGAFGWLGDLDEVERAFYHEGLREGATLALAKVSDDEDAGRVRQLFRELGARTYTKD